MIRQTVAHVDLDAIERNFRAIAGFLASASHDPDRDRVRAGIIAVVKANAYGHGAARGRPGARGRRRGDARVRGHRGGDRPAPGRRARCRSSFSARSSVSDLDGVFEHDADADDLDAPAARALQAEPPNGAAYDCAAT